MTLAAEDRVARFHEFRGPLQQLAQKNPVVHLLIQRYAAGDIITKEECLSQMVIALANQSDELKQQLIGEINGTARLRRMLVT